MTWPGGMDIYIFDPSKFKLEVISGYFSQRGGKMQKFAVVQQHRLDEKANSGKPYANLSMYIYPTYDAALKAAQVMVNTLTPVVIFEAIEVVKSQKQPVIIEKLASARFPD